MGPRRDLDEPAERLLLARAGGHVEGRGAQGRRQHPAGQGVAPLELGGAPGARHLARPEEVLEGVLDQRPVPAPLVALPGQVVGEGDLDLAAGQGPAPGDLVEHGRDEPGVVAGHPLHASPGVLAGPAHPEVEQRPGRRRHQRGLVGPVLHDPAGCHVAGPVDESTVVGPEPGEERQVLAAHDHVDAVDLHHTDGVDDPLHVAGARRGRPRPRETLCRERDAARGPVREVHAERRVTHPWGAGAAGVRRRRLRPASAGAASRGCCARGSSPCSRR